MNTLMLRSISLVLLIALTVSVPAMCEVSVSLTISGPIEEMAPVLQHLKDIGVGRPAAGAEGQLKMEVHSVATSPAAQPGAPAPAAPGVVAVPSAPTAPAAPAGIAAPAAPSAPPAAPAPAPAAPAKPVLALLNAKAEPAAAKAGTPVLVSVQVTDPDRVVDTVSVRIAGMEGSAELYDNGTHGDIAAHDGYWSSKITLPPQLATGDHPVNVTAFNANGAQVMTKGSDGAPVTLTAQTKVAVAP